MSRRRIAVVVLSLAYAALGIAFAAGCRGFAQAGAQRSLEGLLVPEPLGVERVERLVARPGPNGALSVELVLVDAEGAHVPFAFHDEAGIPVGGWSRVLLRRDSYSFDPGTPVHAVADDGSVAAETEPLSAHDRASALLVLLHEVPSRDWFLVAYAPPNAAWSAETSRAPDRSVALYHAATWKLPRPPTPGSLAKRRAASLVLVPASFLVDAATWPLQALYGMLVMSGLGGH